MKNKCLILLFLILSVLFVTACYDDEGNYLYHDVNEVSVDIEENYGVRKQDTVVVIRPGIVQSMHTNNDNLKYEWYYNTFSDQTKGTLKSTGDTIAIEIKPADRQFSYNHYIRFYVTDTLTGAKYLFPVRLRVIKPYEGAWMVLHDQEGSARIGAVEYIGEEMDVTNDAFYKAQGRRLRGKGVALGAATYFYAYQNPSYSPVSLFFCFTDEPEESGIRMQDQDFNLYDSVPRFIYPDHASSFDVSKVSVCEGEGRGRILVCNGSLYQGSLYDSKLYRVRASAPVLNTGEVEITHGTCAGWTAMAFDSKGNRFLHFYNGNNSNASYANWDEATENESEMELVKEDENNINTVDPSRIDEGEKMAYMGTGYWYGSAMRAAQARVAVYALTINETLHYTHVYEFHAYPMWGSSNEEDFPFTFHTSFATPSGMTVHTPMASSCAFNRLLFYAVGNKVYRLDFGAKGVTTLIYQHPDPNAVASVMRFARKDVGGNDPDTYAEMYEAYEFPVMRSLGVGFNLPDGSGEFVVLNLTTAGKVDKNKTFPAEQVHRGFGKIKDVVFI